MTTPILLFVCFVFYKQTNKQQTNKTQINIVIIHQFKQHKQLWLQHHGFYFLLNPEKKYVFRDFFLKKEKNISAYTLHTHNKYILLFLQLCQFDNKTFSINLSLLVWLSEGVLRCGSRFLLKKLVSDFY